MASLEKFQILVCMNIVLHLHEYCQAETFFDVLILSSLLMPDTLILETSKQTTTKLNVEETITCMLSVLCGFQVFSLEKLCSNVHLIH